MFFSIFVERDQFLLFLESDRKGKYATVLVGKKRYDVQCYGQNNIYIFGRAGSSSFDPSQNPAGTGIAPRGE